VKEQDQLAAHMDDLARRASKTGMAFSKFLTPAEKQPVGQHFAGRQDVLLKLDGGYIGAEREIAVFTHPEFGIYHTDDCLSALKLKYRLQDPVSHRDVLGSLMALGIERAVIGDILCESGQTAVICLKSMADYLTEHLQKIGRVGVEVSAMTFSDLPEKHEELTVKTATVASLRLDAVLCAIFRISRGRASELIATQKIRLNHMPATDPSKQLQEGALLSVKGMGRALLISKDGFSKKGRIFIKFGLYSATGGNPFVKTLS
jgi:RNA-binding protein YlmH